MSADPRYFELNDDIGLAPAYIAGKDGQPVENPAAGQLEPLVQESLTLGVPTMVDGELLSVSQSVVLKPIPGTRILKVDDQLVASALAELGKYHEIDAPSQKDLKGARATTEEARTAGQEA